MRTIYLIVCLSFLIAVSTARAQVYQIILKDGAIIETKTYWEEGDKILYQKYGGTISIRKNEVVEVKKLRNRNEPRDRGSVVTKIPSASKQPAITHKLGPNEYMTKGGYVASVSKENLSRAIKYVSQGDRDAFNRMVQSKQVFILKKGVVVYVEKMPFLSGLVKIRPKGHTTGVWTVFEAIGR